MDDELMGAPVLYDLCCCQGGAGTGYHRAGFRVIGVDIEPQPLYPFEFVQADVIQVLEYLADRAEPWPGAPYPAAIHVSPPCQFATTMSARWRKRGGTVADDRVNLLTPVLGIVRTLGIPYVVENVPGAKRYMRPTLLLHGGMFGLGVHRPRLFESSELILAPKAAKAVKPVGVYGDHPQNHYSTRQNGDMKGKRSEFRRARSIDEARDLMGMPWADWRGCKEAIPPAYTEYIGRQLLEHVAAASRGLPHWTTRETGPRELARPNWEYIRVDVLIMEHPKVEGLSDRAFRALIDLWTYCGRHHNDGIVTDRRWKQVPPKVRAELLAALLADPIDFGGVVMHDFVGPDGHQRSRKEIDDAAEIRSEKARKAANSRWAKDKEP